MRVIVHAPYERTAARYAEAVELAGMEPVTVAKQQDFTTALFREPDAIGVLWCSARTWAQAVVREMRVAGVENVIIALVSAVEERTGLVREYVRLLDAGADDAQPEGIDKQELAGRLSALSQRGAYRDTRVVELPGCRFYASSRLIVGQHGSVALAPKWASLLEHLARHPGAIRSKAQIFDAIYGDKDGPEPKIIDVFVTYLRKRILSMTGGLDVVETIHGQGYRLVPEGFRRVSGSEICRPRSPSNLVEKISTEAAG